MTGIEPAFSAESTCLGKVRFDSRSVAATVQERRRKGRKTQCRKSQIYRCSACQGWHLGTPNRSRKSGFKA